MVVMTMAVYDERHRALSQPIGRSLQIAGSLWGQKRIKYKGLVAQINNAGIAYCPAATSVDCRKNPIAQLLNSEMYRFSEYLLFFHINRIFFSKTAPCLQ
jgi:hypothetical protein